MSAINKVLVTYATVSGSTAGVAEAIAAGLREQGLLVDVLPIRQADPAAYAAVVLGSPIHGSQVLPEVLDFLRARRSELQGKPLALFMVCITLAMRNGQRYQAQILQNALEPVKAQAQISQAALFAGVLDLKKITDAKTRRMFRVATWLGIWRQGDHRDWAAIAAWTKQIGPLLQVRQG